MDVAGLGKFDRVAEEIHEALPQARIVCVDETGHARVGDDSEFEALAVREGTHHGLDGTQHGCQFTIPAFDAESPGLDLG